MNPQHSFAAFLGAAALMGGLALLSPCVFPMVPITVAHFARQGGSRRRLLLHAVAYSIGIVSGFTLFGMTLALLSGAAGLHRFASSPWVNLAAAVLFTTFALNLFGVLPVRLPAEWLARLDTRARGAGGRRMLATLLMGGVFTLTSFACTAAFLGTLIVMSAAGDWRWPLAGMLAFSAVFAAPFFLLALLPAWIARLPRGSAWMGSVQVVMGLLELAATVKFLSNSARAWGWNALGRDQVLLAWIALALAAVVYFAACARSLRVAPAFSVLFLAGGAWLASGLPGRSLGALELLLPPDPRSAALGVVDCVALWWVNDYERARHAASRQRRLLLVDNAAPGTRMLEPAILVDPEVMRELSRFVLVRLYAGGAGKPRLLVETPAGEPIAALAGPVDDSRALAAFLRRAHAGSAR